VESFRFTGEIYYNRGNEWLAIKLNCMIWELGMSRGERGHAGHVPGWTSSITDGGDEEKKLKIV
jgi:hypothetical protein